ncbi:hypothetical protein ACFX13_011268 [Malus domestica]|uniref:Cotton fiber protein n=1 Tax=Malus domestica TaxID=3750 RepID=A0A498IBD9_MALDO|nr:uncharacterized protein LOC103414404 [Malus domestica]RXH79295.1 hypothetical protein DVH24_040442 [Malus domestica]
MSKRRLPVFQNLSKLLKVFISVARVRKLSFENSFIRKLQYSKKMKLLKNYDYGFVREYQFSPSNTPLIHYHRRKQLMKNESLRDVYSMFFLCKCWGNSLRVEGEDGDFTLEALPTTGNDDNAVALYEPLDWEVHEEEASIDLRAQMFIERFYEEMRMQRQESF